MPEIDLPADFAIRADGISKKFLLGRRSTSLKDRLTGISDRNREEFWAFEDVSVTVPKGSMLGVIGRNGSGKSTFLRTLCGVYRPTSGEVAVRGRITALLELGAGFHAELTGRENIYMNGAVVGLSRDYMDSVMDEIVNMADIGSFIDAPIETYSSGMRARLGFAVSVQMQPEILLADEITAVGDIAFKEHGVRRMNELRENGATIVQVSHSLPMLAANCDQILWLHHGQVRGLGDPHEVIEEYKASGNTDSSGRMIGAKAKAQPATPKPQPQSQQPQPQPQPQPQGEAPANKTQAAVVPVPNPAAAPNPVAQQVAEREAEVIKELAESELHPEWFESLAFINENNNKNDPELVTGEPAKLIMKLSPSEEVIDPTIEVRVLAVSGRATGLGFDSGSLSPSGFGEQIEAVVDSFNLSAGRYHLRVDVLSAGNVVATKHHNVKVRWPPPGVGSFRPMSSQWGDAS